MSSSNRTVWFITGCSSILGYRLCLAVLARGDLAVAAAASPNDLDRLRLAGAYGVRIDGDMSSGKVKDRIREAVAFYGRVDVLVNCPEISPLENLSTYGPSYHDNTFSYAAIQVTKTVARESDLRQVILVTYDGESHPTFSANYTGVIADNVQATAQLLADEYRSKGVRALLANPLNLYTASGSFIASINTKAIAERIVEKVRVGGSSEPGLQVM